MQRKDSVVKNRILYSNPGSFILISKGWLMSGALYARVAAFSCILLFSLVAVCQAQYPGGDAGQSMVSAEDPAKQEKAMKRMSGTVAKVSFVMGTIMVTGEKGYITFKVPDKTRISRGMKEIALDEIDEGDSVIVQYYEEAGGEKIASFIRDSTRNDY